MRIAISVMLGMSLSISTAAASAQEIQLTGPIGGGVDVAGFSDGFYVRDSGDRFRFFPSALVQTDFLSFLGPGVSTLPAVAGGTGLTPRFFVRRARLSLGGQLWERWTFRVSADLGGDSLVNGDGKAELSAAPAGKTPSALTARYAPVESITSTAGARDVWVIFRAARWLNIQAGQFAVPFSMENRTNDAYLALMEREVAVRSFVVPNNRDMGIMLWGDVGEGSFSYEVGAFGGEGQNRFTVDSRFDFIGRIFVRPFAHGTSAIARYAQIGASARHGTRDALAVGYDYPAITTGQGFILWKPTYTDDRGRLVHVIPSGSQDAVGGELRVRGERVALQGEVYYVNNNTREAIDGFQMTNTERLGRFQGLGWYVQASAWPLWDAFVSPDPGVNRPRTLDNVDQGKTLRRGVELLAMAAGINANYRGATRQGSMPDASTPASNVVVYQLGLGVQYWHTKHVRVSFNYGGYTTPTSGDPRKNQAIVPANLQKDSEGKPLVGHWLHELGARFTISF